MKKRKVCFIITSFIHYSRSFLILDELKKREDIELSIILGGVVLLERFASQSFNLRKILKEDGFDNIHEVYFNVDGDNSLVKAKTVGLGIIEFSTALYQINPDLIVVRGDRFEILSAVTAAVNMNIAIAHIEGGDVSGTIDESIRHAVTKLSHLHFVTNDDAKKRVLHMGENPEMVFNFGSPEVEIIQNYEKSGLETKDSDLNILGSGKEFNPTEEYLMVMYHPVVTELESISENTRNLLAAVHKTTKQAIWFWPNFDAGSEIISHELRRFNNEQEHHSIRFMRYLPPKKFISLLAGTACLIGNSSSGIKESSYLGIPVVNIGSRQGSRLQAENVVNCGNESKEIEESIYRQCKVGRYKSSDIYKSQGTAFKIASKIAQVDISVQKKFFEKS